MSSCFLAAHNSRFLLQACKSNALRIFCFSHMALLWFPALLYRGDVKDSPKKFSFSDSECFSGRCSRRGGKPAVTADGASERNATLRQTEATFLF